MRGSRQAQTSRDGRRNYAIVQMLIQTGIRLDECSQLTLEDIEFGERSGRLKVRQGKGNKARTVPLNASARGLVPAQTSAHTLRHAFARNYLAQYPGDVVGFATLLGHSSLDTTRLYSQPTVEHLSTRVEQLRQNAYGKE